MEKKPKLGPAPALGEATHVALSPQRLVVLEHARANAPVRVADAAARLGLHPNTVREHLEALVALGLVEHTTETPSGRGRPAALYRPSGADPTVPVRAFTALATVLAGQLARVSAHPGRDARAAGIDWGRDLVGESRSEREDPHRAVLDALTRLGFAPDHGRPDASAVRPGIALRRCPLLDAARRYPGVVCQVHLGIVVGALEKLGAAAGPGVELVPFAEPGACRLFLPDPAVAPGG